MSRHGVRRRRIFPEEVRAIRNHSSQIDRPRFAKVRALPAAGSGTLDQVAPFGRPSDTGKKLPRKRLRQPRENSRLPPTASEVSDFSDGPRTLQHLLHVGPRQENCTRFETEGGHRGALGVVTRGLLSVSYVGAARQAFQYTQLWTLRVRARHLGVEHCIQPRARGGPNFGVAAIKPLRDRKLRAWRSAKRTDGVV